MFLNFSTNTLFESILSFPTLFEYGFECNKNVNTCVSLSIWWRQDQVVEAVEKSSYNFTTTTITTTITTTTTFIMSLMDHVGGLYQEVMDGIDNQLEQAKINFPVLKSISDAVERWTGNLI